MAYDKQTFTVGQVLTAAEQNQIEENIEEVRRCHKGSSAPPQLVAGVLWIDDTTSPWLLQVYDGTGWITLGAVDPTGDSFTPSRIGTYVNASDGGPYISSDDFDVDLNVSENTWESIGPTGSGADNIWDALDNVPTDADWVEVKADCFCLSSTGTTIALDIFVRKNGSSVGVSTTAARVVNLGITWTGTGTSHLTNGTNIFKVPVDSDIIFDIHWRESADVSSRNMTLWLTGYGYNEP